jgi:hypothetical protein
MTLWGCERAQHPLELRKLKGVEPPSVEWRYGSEDWQSGAVPAEIASMF